MEGKRQYNNILKVLKENNSQSKILHTAKTPLKDGDKIKLFYTNTKNSSSVNSQ